MARLPDMERFPPAVAFDLDGTLVHSAPDLTGALNAVLARAGRPPVSEALLRTLVGEGANRLIERGLEATGGSLDEDTRADLLAYFLSYYAENICVDSHPFANVVSVLEDLRAAGVPMCVCTNKPERLARRLLAATDLARFFPDPVGGDSLPWKKPDARHLEAALAPLGVPVAGTVMVGDSAADLGVARNAGVPCVLVSFGYTAIPAAELGADILIDDFAELPGALTRLAARALA
ncbi:phosphoglycolate phosphatase [Zavarzinia sp. CC-PAN008]|uniref:phosphoglycolate phosphatase n=1 Tax=Zavarzinia sp. CC-PAN008 TaxID=3243332 RepID=UPI003F748FA9